MKIPISHTDLNWPRLFKLLEKQMQKPYLQQISDFEEKIAKWSNGQYCLAVNSGTAALHLALITLGVGPGDLVLCSTFSFIASSNPILYQGATPVFIDSEYFTWNMDPDLLEYSLVHLRKKNVHPKAVILAHIYGMPAQIDKIVRICQEFDVPLIEDAAESLGASVHNKNVGTFGTFGIYSFNNNKSFTTLGGGALLSQDRSLIQKARNLAMQSKSPGLSYYEHNQIGYNYRINPVSASVGYAQIPKIHQLIQQRRTIYQQYYERLCLVQELELLDEPDEYYSTRWLTTFLLKDKETVDLVIKSLIALGVECRRLWKPLHKQPINKSFHNFTNGTANDLFARGLSLPSGAGLSEDFIELITDNITGVIGK